MKKLIIILSAVMVLFVGFVLWYRWDSGTNHGFQFGYYGEFNRVSNALASIPGVTITQSWHSEPGHRDLVASVASRGPGR